MKTLLKQSIRSFVENMLEIFIKNFTEMAHYNNFLNKNSKNRKDQFILDVCHVAESQILYHSLFIFSHCNRIDFF